MNRRPDRGIIGFGVLWLMMTLVALGLGIVTVGRSYLHHGELQMIQFESTAATLKTIAKSKDNDFDVFIEPILIGKTESKIIERKISPDRRSLSIRIHTQHPKKDTEVEVGWEKRGDTWYAIYWKE